MRLLAIGDIHGYTKPLRVLLDEVAPCFADTVVFLGDYVDKGPDVAGTIDLLLGLRSQTNCIFLRGNHDQMLLEVLQDRSKVGIWESLASQHPLRSYGSGANEEVIELVPPEHVSFLADECRDYWENQSFICVHGGIRPHLSPAEEDGEHLHWMTLSLAAPHLSGKTVICGHSSQASGRIANLGHTICIDTGIAKGGNLTCLDLGDFSYLQVNRALEVAKGNLGGED